MSEGAWLGRYVPIAVVLKPFALIFSVEQLFLLGDVPLKEPAGERIATPPLDDLERLRSDYCMHLLDKMRAPDGGYEEGLVIPGVGEIKRSTAASGSNIAKNNPLSLDEDVSVLSVYSL